MIEIPLTQGQMALIDDEDYELVSTYKWIAHYNPHTKSFYAVSNIRKDDEKWTTLQMHRLIMNAPKGKVVDHIDHDTLKNVKNNLRICTFSENKMNSTKRSDNSSGFKGVSFHKGTKMWHARTAINGKEFHLGYYSTPEDAYAAYCEAAKKHHGVFFNLG